MRPHNAAGRARPAASGAAPPGGATREGGAEAARHGSGGPGGASRPRTAALLGRLAFLLLLPLIAWRTGAVLAALPLAELSPTPLFEDREGGFLSDGEAVYGALGFWSLPDPLPERLAAAVIAIEDRRFYSHPGVDLKGIARASLRSLSGRIEGGSTLAMQVVRMSHPRERTLVAKAEEAVTALLLTAVQGRERVLRRWLETVPMGGNMYGLAYAARRCFRKPVQDLSWAETALLLAVPQDPADRSLFGFLSFLEAKARAEVILGQLASQGVLDEEELVASRSELASMAPFLREERPIDSYHYVFRVLDEHRSLPGARVDRPLRTGLDPGIQALVASMAAAAIPRWRELGADNLAVMVADARDGTVLAYLGSAGYFDEERKGAIDWCRVPRSSGSTLKPFLYALGLESGAFGPDSILADLPLRLKDARGEYSLTDYDDSYLGPVSYRKALANSRNVPAIRVLEGVGLEEAWRWLGRLGLHDWSLPAEFYGYGLAVGGIYVSLDRLLAAYGSLGSDGASFRLRWLRDEASGEASLLVSEPAARLVSLYLADPEARLPGFAGTALTHFPFPVAVKTGTSNGYRDAWALGYSRRYLVGVWTGDADNREMNHLAGSTAAGLLLELFKALQPDAVQGFGEEPFPPPRGWEAVRICQESGDLVGGHCPHAFLEYFPPGAAPREDCAVHSRAVVDSATGELATPWTPAERRVARTITRLGPEYAAFSLSRGYGPPNADPAALAAASVSLAAPIDGTRVLMDPETPARFQTLALRATVVPAVPEIVWEVDGAEFARVPFPYEARWPLSPGTHSFRARFPRAFVESGEATVTVLGN